MADNDVMRFEMTSGEAGWGLMLCSVVRDKYSRDRTNRIGRLCCTDEPRLGGMSRGDCEEGAESSSMSAGREDRVNGLDDRQTHVSTARIGSSRPLAGRTIPCRHWIMLVLCHPLVIESRFGLEQAAPWKVTVADGHVPLCAVSAPTYRIPQLAQQDSCCQ